ncbi:MAG: hypothetical protein IT292_05065 [Deltaproteobacteria bacterium]|nr:hypothetical protein [Deltaproteobacteria bacterium]
MNNELLYRVLGTVESLERSLENSRQFIANSKSSSPQISNDILEHERILGHMRQVVNDLQLQVAQKKDEEVIRSLQIFYSLHHMVKPEIQSTVQRLCTTSDWAAEVDTTVVH